MGGLPVGGRVAGGEGRDEEGGRDEPGRVVGTGTSNQGRACRKRGDESGSGGGRKQLRQHGSGIHLLRPTAGCRRFKQERRFRYNRQLAGSVCAVGERGRRHL
ncbi:MAG: hypothetical protein ACK559_39215, partial [bacterium]